MNVIQQIEAEHAAKLPGAKIPAFQAGDTVVVNVKVTEGDRTRVQAYEGVCIARSGHGLNESFTVRKISYGEGVERVFPVYSPLIELGEGRPPRQGAPRQALLSARSPRQVCAHRRADRNPCRPGGGEGSGQGAGQGTVQELGAALTTSPEASRRSISWRGSMAEPIVAQKAPYAKELEAGKTYYWCACGRSANQPFCDGKHKDSGLTPLAFTAEKSGTAYLCGCKASKNAPYCDGRHKSL